jgi:hypothetical protein
MTDQGDECPTPTGRKFVEWVCQNSNSISATDDTGDPGWINTSPEEYPMNSPGVLWNIKWDDAYEGLIYKSVRQSDGRSSHFFHVMLCGDMGWEYLGMVSCFAIYRRPTQIED